VFVLQLVVVPVTSGLCTCCARLVLALVLVLERVPSNRLVLFLVLPRTMGSSGGSTPALRTVGYT